MARGIEGSTVIAGDNEKSLFSVSKTVQRLAQSMKEDEELRREIEGLEQIMNL